MTARVSVAISNRCTYIDKHVFHISAPYSFDKEMLVKLLEEEKEKIRHKLEKFAVLLKDAGVSSHTIPALNYMH